MGNTFTDWMPVLVASGAEAQLAYAGEFGLAQTVTSHVDPSDGHVYKVLNVPIVPDATASDIQGGDNVFTDLSESLASVTLDHQFQSGFVIRSFEQVTSPAQFYKVYMDASIKAVRREIADAISALLTTGNYSATVSNAGGTSNLLSTTKFVAARALLAANKVPIFDQPNMFYVADNTTNAAMLNDDSWSKATSTGDSIAHDIRLSGKIRTAYGVNLLEDYSMNSLTTGSSTTHTHIAALYHRNAIIVASAPLGAAGPGVEAVDMTIDGLPFRMLMSYSHVKNGWLFSISCLCGINTLRTDSAVICSIAQTP